MLTLRFVRGIRAGLWAVAAAAAGGAYAEDLAIRPTELPSGKVQAPYTATLEATGGTAPYTWTALPAMRTREASTWATYGQGGEQGGEATGWCQDGGSWEVPLPFDFPFCGKTYRTAYINENGLVDFTKTDAGYYAVQTALKNIQSSGLQRDIEVRQIRVEELRLAERDTHGAMVMMNPPYGERLSQDKDVLRLYQDIGTALKHQFSGATAWIISSNEDALKCIGLKPSKRIHLMNGELECLFNEYELFEGEHKEWKKGRAEEHREKEPGRESKGKEARSKDSRQWRKDTKSKSFGRRTDDDKKRFDSHRDERPAQRKNSEHRHTEHKTFERKPFE